MAVMVGIAAERYNVKFNTKKSLFCAVMLALAMRRTSMESPITPIPQPMFSMQNWLMNTGN